MCQHFSGHRVKPLYAAIHSQRATDNYWRNEGARASTVGCPAFIEFALQDTRKIGIVFFSRGGDAMPPIIRGASRYLQEPAHRAYRKFRYLLWDPGVLPGNCSCVALDRVFPTRSTLPFLGLVPPASLQSTVAPWQSLS
jgi:hypothetical protein